MSAKKDYSGSINVERVNPVLNDMIMATDDRRQQIPPTEQEIAERQNTLTTQGRRGCKLKRMCLALSNDNEEFVRIMAGAQGWSRSKFINELLNECREKNQEKYGQIRTNQIFEEKKNF